MSLRKRKKNKRYTFRNEKEDMNIVMKEIIENC